tara:strand:- start:617 stop:736 length:120 start_codon:yes stop_codon:yes gene_type:complete
MIGYVIKSKKKYIVYDVDGKILLICSDRKICAAFIKENK